MADDGLTRYLEELSRHLAARAPLGERFVDELVAHLEEAADRYVATGMARDDAVARALDAIGEPRLLVAHLHDTTRGGIAMPSPFTRWSGLAGIAGALGLAIAVATWTLPTFVLGAALTVLALAGVVARLWGTTGGLGLAGLAVVLAGVAVGPLVADGHPAIVAVVYAGIALLAAAVWWGGALPRPALGVLVAGLVLLLAGGHLELSEGAFLSGAGLAAAGWTWLCYTLFSERPLRLA